MYAHEYCVVEASLNSTSAGGNETTAAASFLAKSYKATSSFTYTYIHTDKHTRIYTG